MAKIRLLRYLGLLLISLLLSLGLNFATSAYSVEPEQLVIQGVNRYQTGDYHGAITDWQSALKVYKSSNNSENIAIVSENIARTYQQLGDPSTAIAYWQDAINHYSRTGNLQKVGRNLTEQAQSYAALGQSRNSINLLCGNSDDLDSLMSCLPNSALEIARQQQDKSGEVAALGSLGEAYRAIGQYPQSIIILEKAEQISDSSHQAAILNSLGNTYTKQADRMMIQANSALLRGSSQGNIFKEQANQYYQKAQEFFNKSIEIAQQQNNTTGQLKGQLNLIQLGKQISATQRDAVIQESLELLEKVSNSPDKIYAAITLANLPDDGIPLTEPLAQCPTKRKLSQSEAENLLKTAEENAKQLQDPRSHSFALGALGHFYECNQDYAQALEYTRQAKWNADQNQANKDSLYLWEWQTGRIQETKGETEPAIAAYQNAVTSLEQIRSDILSSERDVQFDFRDQIEPVYRQLARLRLQKATQETLSLPQKEQELTQGLDTIDRLRLAELQNYLGNDCFLGDSQINQQTELNNPNTAIFNSIILDEETAIIVSLPNGEKKIHWIFKPRSEVNSTLSRFRQGLIESRLAIDDYDLTQARNLYDWLIHPFETDLQKQQINTLVFVQDGLFRTIPMSALYDGEKFLVENYALALTPSLSLVLPESEQKQERALILGVTQPTVIDQQNFEKLTNVPLEVAQVQLNFASNTLLLDEAFNRENLEKELNQSNYKVIHVATHAQFGTIPDDTFLVIGNNNKLTIKELEKVLRQLGGDSESIELLALTACQTAEGDERSTLGLAGVAVQAGVKSVLASLWSIPDESTLQLITNFYQNLAQNNVTKAEALRTAQIALIKAKQNAQINDQYDNPAYWAPFILIGNWN
ncbi:CHAT domain-containing protein [Chroococcus sp. FPU101]|uniref:CHAT domain-containing tetratricopeptide repeat protein n=1 Tax=Chroococcus sp. FPU101 TaxID=1974212 RepID=UPI001A8C6AFC|nr:CHAT domain-containing protein [Chroococcus sp. FPU101]GFE70791.1 TPR repeat [Chroococcus sp. FPU101]